MNIRINELINEFIDEYMNEGISEYLKEGKRNDTERRIGSKRNQGKRYMKEGKKKNEKE